MRSVAFVSLGCAKNLVDTEVMIAKLGAAGWQLGRRGDATPIPSSSTRAPSSIPAKEESTHVILEHAARKRRGQQLIVAGCLAQRYGAQLQSLIPEIDGVVGTGAYAGIVELLDDVEAGRRPVRLEFEAEPEHDFLPRLVTTPRATAYLKIAEGCDHPCTFCIIPALRGAFPQPQRRVDRRRSARARRRRRERADPDRARYLDVGPRPRQTPRRPRAAARAAARDRRPGVDSLALPLSGDGRSRADRRDRAVCRRSASIWTCRCSTRIRKCCARCAGRATASAISSSSTSFARAFRASRCARRSSSVSPARRDEHVAYLEEWIARAQLDRVGFFEYSAEEGTPAAALAGTRRRAAAARAADPLARSAAARLGARAPQAVRRRPCACWSKSRAGCASAIRCAAARRAPEHGSDARKVKRPASMAASISRETRRSASSPTSGSKGTAPSISSARIVEPERAAV